MDWTQTIDAISQSISNVTHSNLAAPSATVSVNQATGTAIVEGQPSAITPGKIFGVPDMVVIGGGLLLAFLAYRYFSKLKG